MALVYLCTAGGETVAQLNAVGWGAGAPPGGSTDPWTHVGAAGTRYHWGLNSAGYRPPVTESLAGITDVFGFACPVRHSDGAWGTTIAFRLDCTTSGTGIYLTMVPNGKLQLYVDNVLQATGPEVDIESWHYLAFEGDVSADPWSGGPVYWDGVEIIAQNTDSRTADTFDDFTIGGTFTTYVAFLTLWSAPSTDDYTTDRYAVRINNNGEGTHVDAVGAWTFTGTSITADIAHPYSNTQYAYIATSTVGDELNMNTDAGAEDIASYCGVTPGEVTAVQVRAATEGEAVTTKVGVGDGTSETLSSGIIVNLSSPTQDLILTTTKPSTGSWAGTDVIKTLVQRSA